MKIGLIPISAKPYHAGHHKLVEISSIENDMTFLFVSTSDRNRKNEFPISGKKMQNIWKSEIEFILPCSVSVEYGGSPVRKVYEAIEKACDLKSKDIYTVYSDPEDTIKNYSLSNRSKYMNPLYDKNQVLFAAEKNPDLFTRGKGTPDVSGKIVREYLRLNDLNGFSKCMPEKINSKNIFEMLRENID
jgi:hypothetical protein